MVVITIRKKGTFISESEIHSVWIHNHLANFKLRLKALEKQVAK